MKKNSFSAFRAAHWCLLTAIAVSSVEIAAQEATHFQVKFHNSCASEVQAKFNHAIALLHSFEYPETSRLFSEIVEQDADCAMAHWGAATMLGD